MGLLIVKPSNIWQKELNQLVANVYNYLAILEALNLTNDYAISELDVVSLFSITQTINLFFRISPRK